MEAREWIMLSEPDKIAWLQSDHEMIKSTDLTSKKASALAALKTPDDWTVADACYCVRHRECGTDLREVMWLWNLVQRRHMPPGIVVQVGVGAGSLSFVLMIACYQRKHVLWDIDIFCSDYRFEDMDPVITGDELNIYNPGYNELCGQDEYLEIIRAAGCLPRGRVITTIGEGTRTLDMLEAKRQAINLVFLDAGKQWNEQQHQWTNISQSVAVNGIVVLHDCMESDVKRSINGFLLQCKTERQLGEWIELMCPNQMDKGRGPWKTGWMSRAWRKTR